MCIPPGVQRFTGQSTHDTLHLKEGGGHTQSATNIRHLGLTLIREKLSV